MINTREDNVHSLRVWDFKDDVLLPFLHPSVFLSYSHPAREKRGEEQAPRRPSVDWGISYPPQMRRRTGLRRRRRSDGDGASDAQRKETERETHTHNLSGSGKVEPAQFTGLLRNLRFFWVGKKKCNFELLFFFSYWRKGGCVCGS